MPCDSQFLFLISCFGNVGQLLKAYKPRMTFEFLCDIQIRFFFFFGGTILQISVTLVSSLPKNLPSQNNTKQNKIFSNFPCIIFHGRDRSMF